MPSDDYENPNGEFYVAVQLFWTAGQLATEKDCEEALVRCGIKVGDLLGEFLIQNIEPPENAA